MPEFSLLTFDCYGTLIDWERGMKNALEGLVKKHNLDLDIKSLTERYVEVELEIEQKGYRKYKEILTLGVRRIFEEKDIKLDSQEAEIFAGTIRKWPPFEETSEVLKILKKEFKLAILSNIDDDLIQHSIRLIGVEFDGVITAEQVRSYKPSHGHWKKMMDQFRLPKENILHVAASYVHDIIPAKELGFKTAWINRKNEKHQRNPKPDFEFRNLRPLLRLLGTEN
ncbi:MAG TPA: haloacid dehalogenase type II [Thermodesulfobacteriota bacterium]